MISIREIAIKCGVSVSTVSKALNDRKDVSKATKEKIIKVAEETGYTTNVLARSLRTKRTYNIGIILNNIDESFSHAFFSNVLESIQKEAEKYSYDITFINSALGEKKISYLRHCEYRNFDGVIIIYTDFESKDIKDLINSNIPVVTIDHIFEECSSIMSDNISGMSELVDYAISMGHKKIAYIHGEDTKVGRDRLAGFYSSMHAHKLEIPKEYLKESIFRDTVLTELKTRELLELKDPPTCIIFPDDYSSISAIRTIQKRNIDISYMGYDGINIAKDIDLTTYEQDRTKLGKLAVTKLIRCIENPDDPIERTIISGKVRIGNTVKNVKKC